MVGIDSRIKALQNIFCCSHTGLLFLLGRGLDNIAMIMASPHYMAYIYIYILKCSEQIDLRQLLICRQGLIDIPLVWWNYYNYQECPQDLSRHLFDWMIDLLLDVL